MTSGRRAIVQARGAILGLAKHIPRAVGIPSLVSVHHVTEWRGCVSGPNIYVGQGFTDVQGRPSPWANPYYFLESDPLVATQSFTDFVRRRADRRYLLRPLFGKRLVCDCGRDGACHAEVLSKESAEMVAIEIPEDTGPADVPVDAVEQWQAARESHGGRHKRRRG